MIHSHEYSIFHPVKILPPFTYTKLKVQDIQYKKKSFADMKWDLHGIKEVRDLRLQSQTFHDEQIRSTWKMYVSYI